MTRPGSVDIASRRKTSKKSWPQLSKVLTEPDLPLTANERLVALVILQHCSMTEMCCYPSIETIRRRARVSKNTVHRAIKNLKSLGLLTVEKHRTDGKFERNIYNFSALKTSCHRVPT